jgi:predicted transcriptional regulator
MQTDSPARGRRNQTSISFPPDLAFRLDQAARELDRSKSWITAAALREYLDRHPIQPDATS